MEILKILNSGVILKTFTHVSVTFCVLRDFFMFFRHLIIFSKLFFRKSLSGIPSECQTDLIQIRLDVLLCKKRQA